MTYQQPPRTGKVMSDEETEKPHNGLCSLASLRIFRIPALIMDASLIIITARARTIYWISSARLSFLILSHFIASDFFAG